MRSHTLQSEALRRFMRSNQRNLLELQLALQAPRSLMLARSARAYLSTTQRLTLKRSSCALTSNLRPASN